MTTPENVEVCRADFLGRPLRGYNSGWFPCHDLTVRPVGDDTSETVLQELGRRWHVLQLATTQAVPSRFSYYPDNPVQTVYVPRCLENPVTLPRHAGRVRVFSTHGEYTVTLTGEILSANLTLEPDVSEPLTARVIAFDWYPYRLRYGDGYVEHVDILELGLWYQEPICGHIYYDPAVVLEN